MDSYYTSKAGAMAIIPEPPDLVLTLQIEEQKYQAQYGLYGETVLVEKGDSEDSKGFITIKLRHHTLPLALNPGRRYMVTFQDIGADNYREKETE